ncbi:MAG: SH3 domain-containing protein [Clostridia bacterium]|nr:SH3 domain-containing protein [Clostridia bacterium]
MKKKLLGWLVLVLCLLAGSALAADFGVVYRTDALNLRGQGSSSSEWLGSYPRGTWVEITGSQNNFYRVRTPDGRTGYMSKNYIDTVGSEDQVWMVEVNNANGGAFLNFRAQPSFNAQVLDIFYNGVPLRASALNNSWFTVELNGQTGYVRSEYVINHSFRYGSGTVATIKTPNNGGLNLRNGPGMNYGVIGQFPGDSYVSVLAEGKDWWCVAVNGLVGYMNDDYLVKGLQSARDIAAGSAPGGGSWTGGAPYAVVSNPVSTQALNLRRYASTASEVLDKLYNGEKLWVDEQGTEWCAVTHQDTGMSGYVMTQYVRLYNLSATPVRRVNHPAGSYVNLRSSPNMGANNVQLRVPHGASVTIVSPGPDWCRVRYGGVTGFMMSYFLQ